MAGSPLDFDFDFVNLIISAKQSGSFEVENDLYSDSKEEIITDASGVAAAAPPPFLESNDGIVRAGGSVGGNPIGGSQTISPYFFINNIDGWRIRPAEEDGETLLTGNLFPLDPDTPFIIPTLGGFTQILRLVVSPQSITDAAAGALTAIQDRILRDIHGQVGRSVYINTERSPGGLFGYQQEPFNSFTDAVDYAEVNGLQQLVIESDAIVDRQLKNFVITGLGLPSLDLNNENMRGTIVNDMNVTGTQGVNGSIAQDQLLILRSNVQNITNFNGAALTLSAVGTIAFLNGTTSLINQLIPFVAGFPVTLDLTLVQESPALASTVAIQNATGSFIVTNMDNAGDSIHITFNQGALTIDASCVAGTVVVAGSVEITDNSGPGCNVIHTATIEPSQIHLIAAMVAGDSDVSLDDQTVTVYDTSVSPRTVLATYSVSIDGRDRRRLT